MAREIETEREQSPLVSFTQEDVDLLHSLAAGMEVYDDIDDGIRARALALATRIAALLPPRTP
jgi:hypothetical protein